MYRIDKDTVGDLEFPDFYRLFDLVMTITPKTQVMDYFEALVDKLCTEKMKSTISVATFEISHVVDLDEADYK